MTSSNTTPPNPIPNAESDDEEPNDDYQRTILNGAWILDKTHINDTSTDDWTMKQYLTVLNLDPLLIETHVKKEMQNDIIYIIYMDHQQVHLTKRTGDNSVKTELDFGTRKVEYLPPGRREKSTIATTTTTPTTISNNSNSNNNNNNNDFGKKFQIQSTLQTVHGGGGTVHSTDSYELLIVPAVNDDDDDANNGNDNVVTTTRKTFMLQTLTIVNDHTGQQSTTKRYFLPYKES